jgi:hypothetical protein
MIFRSRAGQVEPLVVNMGVAKLRYTKGPLSVLSA